MHKICFAERDAAATDLSVSPAMRRGGDGLLTYHGIDKPRWVSGHHQIVYPPSVAKSSRVGPPVLLDSVHIATFYCTCATISLALDSDSTIFWHSCLRRTV